VEEEQSDIDPQQKEHAGIDFKQDGRPGISANARKESHSTWIRDKRSNMLRIEACYNYVRSDFEKKQNDG
jgi:hypothetical protein